MVVVASAAVVDAAEVVVEAAASVVLSAVCEASAVGITSMGRM